MKRKRESLLTDKERIFLHIIEGLRSTQILCNADASAGYIRGSEAYRTREGDGYYVHIATWDKPKPGDLVIGSTGRVDRFKIAWYVSPPADEFGYHVVREIGTGLLIKYGNEEFKPIRGLYPDHLLEGAQREFMSKVHRAFAKGDLYCYRYGGLRFEEMKAFVTIREVFGGRMMGKKGSVPFEVELPYGPKVSIKKILETMRAGGYGTRKFEVAPG